MSQFKKSNYFILTGAMGAGKSTILKELMALNFVCVEESARQIIAEQRGIGGIGIYDKDMRLFIELMLSRAIFQFQQMQGYQEPVIFDRGIPDLLGHASGASLELAHVLRASEKYRYNRVVFFFPGWEEIYQTDDERKMTFEAARQFGDNIRKIYLSLGYTVIDVPFDTPEKRAKYIVDAISEYMLNSG